MTDDLDIASGDAPATRMALILHVVTVLAIDAGILWLILFRIYNKGAYDYGPWYANEYAKWGLTAPLAILAFCLLLTIPAQFLQRRAAARLAKREAQWEAAAQRHCLQTFTETPGTLTMIKHIIADSLAVWIAAGVIELVIILAAFVFRDFFMTSQGSFHSGETLLILMIVSALPMILLLSLLGNLTMRPPELVRRAQLEAAITHRVATRADLQGSLSMETSRARTGALTESIGAGALEQYEEVSLDFATTEDEASQQDRHATQKEAAKTEEVLAATSNPRASSPK